jgi:hypothetical protein
MAQISGALAPAPEGPRWVLPEHLEINPMPLASGIGFGPFILGSKKNDVLASYEQALRATAIDHHSRNISLQMIHPDDNFTKFSLWEGTPRRLVRRDGMVIYSDLNGEERVLYLKINNRGMPHLGGFGWSRLEKVMVTSSGRFFWDPGVKTKKEN